VKGGGGKEGGGKRTQKSKKLGEKVRIIFKRIKINTKGGGEILLGRGTDGGQKAEGILANEKKVTGKDKNEHSTGHPSR